MLQCHACFRYVNVEVKVVARTANGVIIRALCTKCAEEEKEH